MSPKAHRAAGGLPTPPPGALFQNFLLTPLSSAHNNGRMRQRFHTIIRPEHGLFVGWVEEIPGTITHGKSITECRERLRDALQLMLETHRQEARLGLSPRCIQESIELEVDDPEEISYPA